MQNLGFHSLKVLLIGGDDDVFNPAGHFCVLEHLFPGHQRSLRRRNQDNGQSKLRFRHVLNYDLSWRVNLSKHTFVRIAGAVWTVHDKRPVPAGLEFTDMKRVGKSGRPHQRARRSGANAAKTCSAVAGMSRDVLKVVIGLFISGVFNEF